MKESVMSFFLIFIIAAISTNCGVLTEEIAFTPPQIIAADVNALTYQIGTTPLPQPRVLVVTDTNSPLQNHPVTFIPSHPGIMLTNNTVTTNAQGYAVATLQYVIAAPGGYYIESRLQDGTSLTLPFTVVAGAPANLAIIDSAEMPLCNSVVSQTAAVVALTVQLQDALSYPIADAAILFHHSSVAVTLSSNNDFTDTAGQSSISVMINPVTQITPVQLDISTLTDAGSAPLSIGCNFTIVP